MKKIIPIMLALISINTFANTNNLPSEIYKNISNDEIEILSYKKVDLNNDNIPDYIFIEEKPSRQEANSLDRILKIAIFKNNKFEIVKQNNKIIYCSTCGGAFGDPFESLEAKKNSFTVKHYGGSNDRWFNEYRFNYSRIDNTWQLVMVKEGSFNTSSPHKIKQKIYIPPKDFGKIDIQDFDPDNYMKK